MRPIHPGEVLREDYLIPLGLSANALAKALNVPAPRINDIVREKRGVTADTAMRLARYLAETRVRGLTYKPPTIYVLQKFKTLNVLSERYPQRQLNH